MLCVPFGIIYLVYAARVDSLLAADRFAEALESSKKARYWGRVAIAGLICVVLAALAVAGFLIFGAVQGMPVCTTNQ